MNKILSIIFLACFATITLAEEKNRPVLTEPGIVLTFDDSHNLDSWAKRVPLFEKYGAKATFFLHKPDTIGEWQQQCMKKLSDIGCEMACHGWRHVRGSDLITEKGKDAYLAEEILPANKKLEELGYPQRTFAYPESRRNDATDEALKPIFLHVRTGGGLCERPFVENNSVFTPVAKVRDQFLIYGVRLDHATPDDVEKYVQPALERAKKNGEILLLYSHGIVDKNPSTYETNEATLEELLKRAQALGLKFYTFDEL